MAKGDRLYNKALSEATSEPVNNDKAFQYLERSAKVGNYKATYALATWYLFGKHVKKDLKKGVDLLKIAADMGSSDACFDLAVSYEKGKGIEENIELAFKYYLFAAINGDTEAIHEIGRCYFYGKGVVPNKTLGKDLLKLYNKSK